MNLPLLQQIQHALIDLSQAMSASDTSRMVGAMEALDSTVRESRAQLPPRLLHFLEQRSYAKAQDWLGELLAGRAS